MSSIIQKLKYVFDFDRWFMLLGRNGVFDYMSDEKYIRRYYKAMFSKPLNLDSPSSFSEKLQWLKLHDRRSEYTQMVDKYRVKEYVRKTIGEKYVIPTYGVWKHFDEINFNNLPNSFVLKCTHDSGGLVICRDKSDLDKKAAKIKLENSLRTNYYYKFREWPYKNVNPCIIAEQYLEDQNLDDLPDYKVHNFNGNPKVVLVCRGRFKGSEMTEDFYSDKWEHLEVRREMHPNGEDLKKPQELDEILDISRKLSKDIPFVRTDFYVVNHRVYFGEMTFFPASGFVPFIPNEFDDEMGKWINLSEIKCK